jgi:type IV pilus assembly protein PilV
MPLNRTTHTGEGGFTLIEVLISILILSIGIFGILAIITVSLQLNSSSVYRTIAAQQAYAMAEVLRANPTAIGTASAASAVSFSAPGAIVDNTLCFQSLGGCPRNAYITTSIWLWQQQLASVLPNGQGTVCLDSTPNDGTPANWQCDGAVQAPYVVKICWNESRIAASSSVSGTGGTTSGGGGLLCTYTSL